MVFEVLGEGEEYERKIGASHKPLAAALGPCGGLDRIYGNGIQHPNFALPGTDSGLAYER